MATPAVKPQVLACVDDHRFLSKTPSHAQTIALCVVSLIPPAMILFSFRSASQAIVYEKKLKLISLDPKEREIFQHLKTERVASAVSQFIMGLGLILLLAALIISFSRDATALAYGGLSVFGIGLLGYIATQFKFYPREGSAIMIKYHELLKATTPPVQVTNGANTDAAASPNPRPNEQPQPKKVSRPSTPHPLGKTDKAPSAEHSPARGPHPLDGSGEPGKAVVKAGEGDSDSDGVVISGPPSRAPTPPQANAETSS